MDGQTDGRTDGRTDSQTDRQMEEQTDRRTDRQTEIWTIVNGWIDQGTLTEGEGYVLLTSLQFSSANFLYCKNYLVDKTNYLYEEVDRTKTFPLIVFLEQVDKQKTDRRMNREADGWTD